ncbi:DUF4097 family beta strand repeat protein [candidate division KSB1 bacterium]|nr:DUF4097 family beta strand repeat protein [candidate division KSB1 bacterium]
MKKIILTISSAIICLLLLTSIYAQEELRKEGSHYVAEFEKEFKVADDGNLVIKDVQGDITIKTWDQQLVKINEVVRMDVYTKTEAEAVVKDMKTRYQQQGNTITIGAEGSFRSYMQSAYTIQLPKKFNVDVNTRGGDIEVFDLAGRANLRTSGGDVALNNVNGVVDVSTSGGDVKVYKNTNSVALKTSGGDIEIIDVMGAVDASTSGGDILVQNNRANVSVKTSGGDIVLENVGSGVSAKTSGGDIAIDGTEGDISVATSGGDIKIKKVKGTAKAMTSGGDIDANDVATGIVVSTSGGDIRLHNIEGFMEGSTSGGNIEAEMTLTDFSKDHHVKLSSSAGDITLYIPEKLPATISAKVNIRQGGWKVRTRDYEIQTDFDLEKKVEGEKDDIQSITAQGKINGGGDLISIETNNSNIRILKLK